MTRIIAITNQKGGVGKTTTAVSLSAALAVLGQKVLLIDLDPQGNATTGCGLSKNDMSHTLMEALLEDYPLSSLITKTEAGFEVVPSNSDLTVAEVNLLQKPDREMQLKKLLEPIQAEYDFILLDCPPSLNMLTVNSLVAAHSVLIPMQCEYFALEGLSSLLETIESVRHVNPDLQIDGLLRTLYDGRNSLSKQVAEQLISHFKEKVYQTVIPRNVRLAEAPSHGQPIVLYDRFSTGAVAYLALAEEILYGQEALAEAEAVEDSVAENTEEKPVLLRERSAKLATTV